MNKVIMMGNLPRDVEIRDGANNTTVVRVGIAVNRPFKPKEVDFFNPVAFNKTAEFLSKYFTKGRRILIEGRIQSSSYENKDGLKVNTADVMAEQIKFADSKPKSGGSSKHDTFPPDLDDSPF